MTRNDTPTLSYADYFDHPLKRRMVRAVERLAGQKRIQKMYQDYLEDVDNDEPFFAASLKLLDLDVQFNPARHAGIPKTGPLVIVANHPFGVLDGAIISWLVWLVRKDFKILTNAVFGGAPEAAEWILPIDFSPTKDAQTINIATRKESLARLKRGECIIVFPSGGVSTVPRPFSKMAVEDTWKPFTAKLISQSGANVVPVFFEGQNSRLFQLVSHLSIELRLALMFREVNRKRGKRIAVHIGEVLTPEDLTSAGKRAELMTFLRDATYGLSPKSDPDSRKRAEARFQARKPKVYQ